MFSSATYTSPIAISPEDTNKNTIKEPPIESSQNALNYWREQTDPRNILRYQNDPLEYAFEMSMNMKRKSEEEMEFKKEYLELSKKCKRFCVELYDECRSQKEMAALLNIDESNFTNFGPADSEQLVNKLKIAIERDQKEFVAHRFTQKLLNTVINCDVPEWFRKTVFHCLTLFTAYTVLFPIFAVIYVAFPNHKISKWMRTPYLKFTSHVSQFTVFLGLLVASSLRDSHEPSIVEYLIFAYIVGMTVQETREMWRHRPRKTYFFKWWNCVTSLMLVLFISSGLFWLSGFAITGGWSAANFMSWKEKTGHRLLLLGNSCFSLGSVLSIFHLSDTWQVNKTLGPLQHSMYRMFRDIMKFLTIFLGVFLAFTLGIRNLYSYYRSIQRMNHKNENIEDTEADRQLTTFWNAMATMFWALFDKVDLEVFNTNDDSLAITQTTGRLMFALFNICAVLVGINTLIAMMNNSYEYVAQNEDSSWKFSRTRMWLEFIEQGNCLPPPYNIIIPNPRWIKRKLNCAKPKFSPKRQNENERQEHLKVLTDRYLERLDAQEKQRYCTMHDMEDCKAELLNCKAELLNCKAEILKAIKECIERKDQPSSQNSTSNSPTVEYIIRRTSV